MKVQTNTLAFKVLLVAVVLITAFSGQAWANQEADNGFTVALFDQVVKIQDQQKELALFNHLDPGIISGLAAKADRAGTVRLNEEFLVPGFLKTGDNLLVNAFADKSYLVKIENIDLNKDSAMLRGSVSDSYFGVFALSTYQDQTMAVLRLPEENSIYILSYSPGHDHYFFFEGALDRFDYPKDIPARIPPESMDNEAMVESMGTADINDSDEQNLYNRSMLDAPELVGSPGPNDPATIDVMVVYTPAAKSWAGGLAAINNQINLAMILAQEANDNSNTGITMRLVHSAEVSYIESGNISTDLNRLTARGDGYMEIVHSWRNQYGADLVALFTSGNQGGTAWLFTGPFWNADQYGFSVSNVQYVSLSYLHIHEMGHNMGAHHHKLQNQQPGPNTFLNTYSAGWRFEWNSNWYNTLMSYSGGVFFNPPAPGAGISSVEIGYFSSPLINYMGVPTGHATDGDNARTLRETKHYIASFRESTPLKVGSVSVSIEPVKARTAGAQWRLTTGPNTAWKNSGDVIENLTVNAAYTITFKSIAGWVSPDDVNVTIVADETIYEEGTYSESATLYCQDFSIWLPEGWSKYQLGSQTPTWQHSTEDKSSAWHNFDVNYYLDNWLVSPPISLPASGTIALSFLEKNKWVPDHYGYSGVFISAGSDDPNSGSWEELYESNMPVTDWTEKEINISQYAGHTVYLGFNYQGQDTHEWWIDDFCIFTDQTQPGSDIELSALTIDPGTLVPDFEPATTFYTLDVAYDVESIAVSATISDSNATLTINGNAAESGVARTVSLGEQGTSTKIDIVVTAEDDETVKTYTITVDRGEDDQETHTITLSVDPGGGGEVEGEGTYVEGEEVTVIAIPAEGYEFNNWAEDGEEVSDSKVFSFTVTNDRELVANFTSMYSFDDVTSDHPFFDYIEAIYAEGITEGYNDGTFRPSANVTRMAMAAMLVRCLDLEDKHEVPEVPSFIDVSSDYPFYEEIELLAASGISTGWEVDEGYEFRPGEDITRMAMVAMLDRALGLEDDDEIPDNAPNFVDVGPDHPFYEEIKRLVTAGITTGWVIDEEEGIKEFRPNDEITRMAMAAFLVRGLEIE